MIKGENTIRMVSTYGIVVFQCAPLPNDLVSAVSKAPYWNLNTDVALAYATEY
jgi:hypothetical protein